MSSGGTEIFVSSGGHFSPAIAMHGAAAVQAGATNAAPASKAMSAMSDAPVAASANPRSLASNDLQELLKAMASSDGPVQTHTNETRAAVSSPSVEATVAQLIQAMASFHPGAPMGQGSLFEHTGEAMLAEGTAALAAQRQRTPLNDSSHFERG